MSQILSKKSEHRRQKIIEAGLELFLKNGFENTSLSDIIALSGGSLSTIYKCFGSKEGLFRSIIEFVVEDFSQRVKESVDIDENTDLRTFLSEFGRIYVKIVFSQYAMLLKKLVFSEILKQNSQVVQIFHESGVKAVHAILIEFFEKSHVKSTLKETNLELLAFRFCFLLEEPVLYRKNVLGENLLQSQAQIDEWVKNCVEFVLFGVYKNQI